MQRAIVVFWLAAAMSVAVGVLLTGLVRRYALARSLIDIPNERSSHTVATPRGGGVAIVACYIAIVPVLWFLGLVDGRIAMALLGAVAIAMAGWWDDHADLSPVTRLAVQVAAAAWSVAWLHGFHTLSLGATMVHLGMLGSILAVLALVWLCNLYNFMDGIDGLAGSEAVVVGAAIAAMLWRAGAPGLAIASAVLGASALGFLVWNWPPARIFMGDVGSGTIGFAFGTIALAAHRSVGVPALIILLPLGVFIADATFTLVRRAIRRERIYAGHRSHVYQRLVQLGWEHDRVTSIAILLTVAVSALAVFALWYPNTTGFIMLATAGLLLVAGWLLVRSASNMTGAVAQVIPAAAVPADDDGGDITVMLRRQA